MAENSRCIPVQRCFAVARLLDLPGMVAVVSKIEMENGYIVFPVAYCAERRPPPQDLTASWPRTNYSIRLSSVKCVGDCQAGSVTLIYATGSRVPSSVGVSTRPKG